MRRGVADLARSAVRIADALDASIRCGITVRRAPATLGITRTLRALVRGQVARSAIGAVGITKTLDANVACAIRRRLRALTVVRARRGAAGSHAAGRPRVVVVVAAPAK